MFKLSALLVCLAAAITAQDCIVPFGSKKHWDVFWPLVFHQNGSLYRAEFGNDENIVVVPQDAAAYVSCGPNFLRQNSLPFIESKCRGGKFVEGNIRGKQLACDLRAIEAVITPVEGCDRRSTKFGFVHPIDGASHITGEACYCRKDGRTLFAHVRLGNEPECLLEVQNKDFLNQEHPDTRYKVDFMKAFRLDEFNDRLRQTLKISDVPGFKMANYVDSKLLWNDQLAATRKLSWNYFVMHENLFNFDLLKEDIADLGKTVADTGKAIDIYIGSHGVVTVKAINGEQVAIYLDEMRFPVPEFIWIVVKNGAKAAGFVVFNDPTLVEEDIDNNSLCKSKCEEIGWLKRVGNPGTNRKADHGGVLCCEYSELKNKIDEIPELSGISEFYKSNDI